jgi:photosystem II stability/assembly factor-like uncharacterized protein
MKRYILLLFALFFITSEMYAQQVNETRNYFQAKKQIEEQLKSTPEGLPNKQMNRWLNFWEVRVDENGNFPNTLKVYRDLKNFDRWNKDAKLLNTKEWKLLGPTEPIVVNDDNHEYYHGLGRINCIRFDPTDPDILWAGAASGGLWKSTDGGMSWRTFEFTNLLSLGITDIAVAPSNPEVVYITTGDLDGSLAAGNKSYSLGVIKTTNGGIDWEVSNLGEYQLENNFMSGRILVHPEDENIVITSTSEGIFRTENGGQNWDNVLEQGVMVDMEFMPGNPDVVYASTYRSGTNYVFKSDDNGESWLEVLEVKGTMRTALAVTPANPDKVYCLFVDYESYQMHLAGFHSFYVSDDQGDGWDLKAHKSSTINIIGKGEIDPGYSYGWYYICLDVDPNDEDKIFAGGYHLGFSEDGGESWDMMWNHAPGDLEYSVHVDLHDVRFIGSKEVFLATDGGLYKSENAGMTWDFISKDMSITQFYRIGCNPNKKEEILGGCQDNGTRRSDGEDWVHVSGGDGMECIVDPDYDNTYYTSSQNGMLYRVNSNSSDFMNWVSGGNWTTPFEMSQSNHNHLYAVGSNVMYTTNRGDVWDNFNQGQWSQMTALELQQQEDSQFDIVYVANRKQVRMFTDPTATPVTYTPKVNTLTDIESDPNEEGRFWITNGGYEEGEKVLEFDGEEWVNISYNLPNIPVLTIVHQDDSPERLFIGSDAGVFYKEGGWKEWRRYGEGLPNVIINELEIFYGDKETLLRAGTYGRGVWEVDITPDPNSVYDVTKEDSWQIGPVPAIDYITLSNEEVNGITNIMLLDLSGKTIKSLEDVSNNILVDLNGISKGVYILQIENNGSKWTEKIIVE